MRRSLDLLVAGVLLVLAAPLLAAIAVAVRWSSPGPVFHRPQRVGQDGKLFTLYKFRTMVVGAAGAGPGITRSGDPRITRVGRWLRATKVDELPQLFNVLKEDMSLVGPRPEDPRYVALYTPEQRRVLHFRPGITSPASIEYRNEEEVLAASGDDVDTAYRQLMGKKIDIDLAYFEHRTIRSDVGLMLTTLRAVVQRAG